MTENCDPCVDNADLYTATQPEPGQYEWTIYVWCLCKGMSPGVSEPWMIQAA